MRLRRSDVTGPGWRRVRKGRGFTYTDDSGAVVDASERIASLAIPPAWRDVWISPHANGHIQAVWTDDAGRRQYLYHPRWREARDAEKHDRVLTLAPRLPAFRDEVRRMMSASGRERVLGVALHLLDRGIFRVGGETYAQDNGSHGVATLLREHVAVRGPVVEFRFPAKGGIEVVQSLRDPGLARVVRGLRRRSEGRLLVYWEGRKWCEVTADEVNARFKEMVGEEYSVKDLRTWHATVSAAVAFARVGRVGSGSQRGMGRVEAAVMREVGEELGNTAAVARKSYVDPRVVEGFEEGRTLEVELGEGELVGERREEVEGAVVRLLKG